MVRQSVRRFNGKLYGFAGAYPTKRKALFEAALLKRTGELVRIIPADKSNRDKGDRWAVYVR